MEEDVLHINLLGTTLSIKSGTRPEYIKKVIAYYQRKLGETESRSPVNDPVKLSILTSLNIIDDLFKLESNNGHIPSQCSRIEETEIAEKAQSMIDELDRILTEN